jgi:hypothetical protein
MNNSIMIRSPLEKSSAIETKVVNSRALMGEVTIGT